MSFSLRGCSKWYNFQTQDTWIFCLLGPAAALGIKLGLFLRICEALPAHSDPLSRSLTLTHHTADWWVFSLILQLLSSVQLWQLCIWYISYLEPLL